MSPDLMVTNHLSSNMRFTQSPMMHQLGDEDCILPSKLQAALQQVLEERELILGEQEEKGSPEGQSPSWVTSFLARPLA